jgi:hypothetical protein
MEAEKTADYLYTGSDQPQETNQINEEDMQEEKVPSQHEQSI